MRMQTIHNKLKKIHVHLGLLNADAGGKNNKQYCSKMQRGAEGFWETGDINLAGQGIRSDLKTVTSKVLGKRSLREIATEHPETWVRYHRGIESLAYRIDDPPDERPMETILYYGDARTGKSTKARSIAKLYGRVYRLKVQNKKLWWDGYQGEPSILIDEFKGWIDPRTLNEILDPFKYQSEIKGGHVYAKYEHVFITSHYDIEEWWSKKVVWDRQALRGRISSVYEFRGTNHVNAIITKLK